MQTIKINIEQTQSGCEFSTGFQAFASANNLRTFPDAVEFISDAITNHFAAFGLNVEFANA